MKLYVCWNTSPGPKHMHPCGAAHAALVEAGFEPEVVKARGFRFLPYVLQRAAGRREVKRLTGSVVVPVLITDDGAIIAESARIIEWARANSAQPAA